MAGHAAARGNNALGRMHAVNVFGAGLVAHQNDRLAGITQTLSLFGIKHDLAGRRAWRGRKPLGHDIAHGAGINGRVQELVQRRRLNPHNRFMLGDGAIGGHIDRDLQRRLGCAFAIAGLQHIELAALDRELDILHVAIVPLKPLNHSLELAKHLRHGLFHGQGFFAHFLARNLG